MFGRLLKRRTKELHDKAFEYKQCPEKKPHRNFTRQVYKFNV